MLNIKVLGALVACALIVAVPSLAHGGPVVGHPLAKGTMQATTINAQAGSMIFEKITIAPGGSFGWHSHPGPSLVIVKSGTLSVYHGPNCMMEEYGPGSALGSTFVDQGHDLHLVRNNTTAVDDVYVVSFLPAGFARRIDEPNPNPAVCPN